MPVSRRRRGAKGTLRLNVAPAFALPPLGHNRARYATAIAVDMARRNISRAPHFPNLDE